MSLSRYWDIFKNVSPGIFYLIILSWSKCVDSCSKKLVLLYGEWTHLHCARRGSTWSILPQVGRPRGLLWGPWLPGWRVASRESLVDRFIFFTCKFNLAASSMYLSPIEWTNKISRIISRITYYNCIVELS